MYQTTVIMSWQGPYALSEIESAEIGNGLYLLIGRGPRERKDRLQYCGITAATFYKRFRVHDKIGEIRNLSIWLGTIEYPHNVDRYFLETAEKMIVHFWRPTLNIRKKEKQPSPICVISK